MRRDSYLSSIAGGHLTAALAGLAIIGFAFRARSWAGFWLGALVLVVSTVAASVLTARRLARPLVLMADDASRIARGHADRVAVSGTRETRQLSEAINRMAEELAGVIEELRSETDLREQILGAMREGVILAGPSSDLIYSNQAATEMFGRHRIEMVPPQIDGLGEQEFTVYHPRRLELRSMSVRLGDGRTLCVIQDQTERKRVESIRRDFVANASHELKTPVSGILVTAETVEQAIAEDVGSARRFAANLVREARRLSALVQDLLDLARLEEGKEGNSTVDLKRVIAVEVDELKDRIEQKGLILSVDLPDEATVIGVKEDLALMVRNLLENAVGYTATGSISVGLRDTGQEFRLDVSDTGVGIPTSDLERVFERFYRVDRARSRDTGGTGLGLAIVRHVVETCGGSVKVTSELGDGSTFTVLLPYPPVSVGGTG